MIGSAPARGPELRDTIASLLRRAAAARQWDLGGRQHRGRTDRPHGDRRRRLRASTERRPPSPVLKTNSRSLALIDRAGAGNLLVPAQAKDGALRQHVCDFSRLRTF